MKTVVLFEEGMINLVKPFTSTIKSELDPNSTLYKFTKDQYDFFIKENELNVNELGHLTHNKTIYGVVNF